MDHRGGKPLRPAADMGTASTLLQRHRTQEDVSVCGGAQQYNPNASSRVSARGTQLHGESTLLEGSILTQLGVLIRHLPYQGE